MAWILTPSSNRFRTSPERWRGIADDGLAVQELFPGQEHRGAVIAHRAGEDDLVSGRAAAPDTPGKRTSPTPAVVMKTLSAEPLGTTLVSPVTMATPASAAVACMDSAMVRKVSISRPSSRMKEADSTRGRAAAVSRSFTVPATAKRPISPPGKKMGSTTKESVVKAN